MTIATAPRTREGLIALGRFGLRKLAQELGLISSADDEASFNGRVAFMGSSTEQQAKRVLEALHAVDAKTAKKTGSKNATMKRRR
jgi:hypothetical protein